MVFEMSSFSSCKWKQEEKAFEKLKGIACIMKRGHGVRKPQDRYLLWIKPLNMKGHFLKYAASSSICHYRYIIGIKADTYCISFRKTGSYLYKYNSLPWTKLSGHYISYCISPDLVHCCFIYRGAHHLQHLLPSENAKYHPWGCSMFTFEGQSKSPLFWQPLIKDKCVWNMLKYPS